MIRLPRNILCVDWDKRSLRMVVARIGGGPMQLEDAHSHRVPNTVDADDPQAMGGFIAQMQRRHRWHHRRVIVDVPRDKVVLNRMTLPPTPVSELAAAVRFQALKELPFPLDEAVIDHVILQSDEDGRATEVLLAAVRAETLARLRETCQAAGLTPARIGLRPYANRISVCQLPGLAEQRVLYVDVGPTMTEIDIICGGALAFSRAANVTLPLTSGELITDSTAASAAELAGFALSDESERTAIAELLVEITRTLQAYRATDVDAAVDRILIGGSSGLESQLAESVGQRFELPTDLFDPTDVLDAEASEAAKLRSFSAALGLAWGLGEEGLLELDFINPKKPIPPRQTLKRNLRIAGIAAAVVLIAAGTGFGKHVWDKKGQLAALQAEIDRDGSLAGQAKAELDILDMVDVVKDWERGNELLVWLDHLLALTQNMIEPGKKMLVEQATLDERKGAISLDLLCADHEILTAFIETLNQIEDGKKYQVVIEQSYREDPKREAGLRGEASVRVELLQWRKHVSGTDQRERDRKKRRRKVLSEWTAGGRR